MISDGDSANDIIYYQENIRFVETFVRPGNLTVLWGDCDDASTLGQIPPLLFQTIHISMEVGHK